VTLGLAHQRHYETRSTFINLAEAGGALAEDVHRLTHASLGEAKDLYRRIPQRWPRLCRAVRAVQIEAPAAGVAVAPEQTGNGEISEVRPWVAETAEIGRARESNPPAAPLSTTHRF
jgi:hypothetical protein